MALRLLLGISLSAPAQATPPAPPAPIPPLVEARSDLDGDGQPERLFLGRDGVLHVEGADGRERGQVTLPGNPKLMVSASLAFVTVEEHRVAHLRARLHDGRTVEVVVALAGPLETLFDERTGPVGDGERRVRLRVDENGVVRFQTSPTITRCDGDDMLFPERWDFASKRFRPVDLDSPPGLPLKPASSAPGGLAAEPLGLFHFVAASTEPSAAAERRADLLAAPSELEDGNPSTLWTAGGPGAGRGEWATARAQDPSHRIRALRISAGPGPSPRAITLLLGPGAASRFTVRPPARGTFFVALPDDAPPTACVSLVIAEPPSPAGSPGTALAEVAIFTDADVAGGLEQLAADVAACRSGSDAAGHVLAAQGARGARAVAEKLPTAQGPCRRQLIEILAQLAEPDAAPALGHALETAAADERELIVHGLQRLGARGAAEAVRVYVDPAQAAEAQLDAAQILGTFASSTVEGSIEATRVLLAGAGRGEGPVRGATVRALAAAGAARLELVRELAAALTNEASRSADGRRLADLARALGAAAHRQAGGAAEAAPALKTAWEHAPGDFETRLRLVRAIGELDDPSLAPILAAAAREPGDEVLRWAAVEGAAALPGEAARAILTEGAHDRDPRVRRSALTGLAARVDGAGAGAVGRSIEDALARDGWPLVRHAAAEALGGACSLPGVEAALAHATAGDGDDARGADPAEDVRRSALVSLARCAPRSPAIARALGTRKQPLGVRELAAALVAKGDGPDAARTLATVLDETLADPSADERSAGLAVACTRGLARTHDTSRPILESLGAASNEPLSPSVRAAAMETIGRLCPDGAGVALKRGAADPDPIVRRAAGNALRTCAK